MKNIPCLSLIIAFLGVGAIAEAQQAGKVYRIGTLENSSPSGRAHLWEAFRQGLRERGYVEGKKHRLGAAMG